jgi:hypothetical protein
MKNKTIMILKAQATLEIDKQKHGEKKEYCQHRKRNWSTIFHVSAIRSYGYGY